MTLILLVCYNSADEERSYNSFSGTNVLVEADNPIMHNSMDWRPGKVISYDSEIRVYVVEYHLRYLGTQRKKFSEDKIRKDD